MEKNATKIRVKQEVQWLTTHKNIKRNAFWWRKTATKSAQKWNESLYRRTIQKKDSPQNIWHQACTVIGNHIYTKLAKFEKYVKQSNYLRFNGGTMPLSNACFYGFTLYDTCYIFFFVCYGSKSNAFLVRSFYLTRCHCTPVEYPNCFRRIIHVVSPKIYWPREFMFMQIVIASIWSLLSLSILLSFSVFWPT